MFSGLTPPQDFSGLTPQDFTDQRTDAIREGVKGLFLMNGGGAVALLVFLEKVWKGRPLLAKYIIVRIAFLVLGVVLAGLVHFFRVHASVALQSNLGIHSPEFLWFRRTYFAFAYLSVATFIVGMGVVLCGAWQLLLST